MSGKTNIAWCDSTVIFWSGCANCYAEMLSKRQLSGKTGQLIIGKWGHGALRVQGFPKIW